MAHVLDTLVWSALTGRQAGFGVGAPPALRFAPAFGLFIGVPDYSRKALSAAGALVREHGPSYLMEPGSPEEVPGCEVVSRALGVQMVAEQAVDAPPAAFEIVPLSGADAPQMLALATATRPGPFFTRTHELGSFCGVKAEGRLVAMAGERLRAAGYTEVSGVCTDPAFRGRGYAAGLMRRVMAGIRARGETPILHSYADNAGAIALYESLGFRRRTEVIVTSLAPA